MFMPTRRSTQLEELLGGLLDASGLTAPGFDGRAQLGSIRVG